MIYFLSFLLHCYNSIPIYQLFKLL